MNYGRKHLSVLERMHRHVHGGAYAAVVLSGGYEEAGDCGRFRVTAGDVLFHDAFDGHLDRAGSLGAEILNLSLPIAGRWPGPIAEVDNPDELVRAAEQDQQTAIGLLLSSCRPVIYNPQDWISVLAVTLSGNANIRLEAWADAHGLSPAALSRGFQRVFGTTPRAFRARLRARRAWRAIIRGRLPLGYIAAEFGFADQPHMTRDVRAVTGSTPGAWRAMIKCVQDGKPCLR